eukprot:COSAG06_NODE_51530_length_311_cov_1.075472_1_plen_21_part_10
MKIGILHTTLEIWQLKTCAKS